MKVKFALFLSCTVLATAAVQKVNLKFDTLTLRDGKKLERVVIRSYDPEDGKVIMLANRHLVSYQIDQLPETEAQQIAGLAPIPTGAAPKIERIRKNAPAGASAAAAPKPAKNAPAAVNVSAPAPATVADEQARRAQLHAAQSQALLFARARQLAGQRADRYYRLEFHPAVGSLLIIDQSTQLAEPVAIPGADGRYRVAGTIGLQYSDEHGRDTNRVTQPFEVIVGPDTHGGLVTLEFKAI